MTTEDKIRVLVVDDQELVRYGFRLALEAEPDLLVVGEAGDGAAAVAAAQRLQPDVVLMDVRMPGMNGLDAAQKVTTLLPETRVLILTTFDLDDYAFGALRAGASGFLLKDTRPAELIAAVRAVHRGDAVMAPRITAKLINLVAPQLASTRTEESGTALASLTPREREVFVLIGQGATNSEIATELYLSESTVKTHVGRILLKQGLRDRVQAVILAYELGVVKP